MSKRILSAAPGVILIASLTAGCVKEITSDERLERETSRNNARGTATADELLGLKCDDLSSDMSQARDETQAEDKRLTTYLDLIDSVKDRTARFNDALSRNPDLAYQEGSQDIIAARDGCIDVQADLRRDFESLVREIVQVPVVDDYKDGKAVKAARTDFGLLRDSIKALDLDDREQLNTRLNNAEKNIEKAAAAPPPRKGKK